MKKLAYITNTDLSNSSGGGSGVNFATYTSLNNKFDIKYLKVDSKDDLVSKIKPVVSKKLGFKRNYHFFSEKRLNNISQSFNDFDADVDAYFFHGYTNWIDTKPTKPYFCFNDACFATYVEIYNDRNEFTEKDLDRI
jgi:hypothetical protein